jgi:hypothetical protein
MKRTVIVILVAALTSICVAQNEKDTVNIYWQNGQLKYMFMCCFIDTIVNPPNTESIVIKTYSDQMWDETGNEIHLEDYLQSHKDIVIIEEPAGKGDDEKEYRRLIAKADQAYDSIDINNIASVNRTIKYYVQAKDLIPDATYPDQRLEKIQELIYLIKK